MTDTAQTPEEYDAALQTALSALAAHENAPKPDTATLPLIEALPVGATLTRTEQGWEVSVPRGGNPGHGVGRSIVRAFAVIDSHYEVRRDGTRVLVGADGSVIPAEK